MDSPEPKPSAPPRETVLYVVSQLLDREEAATRVAKLIGRSWSVDSLKKARRGSERRPPFPDPVREHPLLWYGPDVDAWVPYAFPKPRPGESAADAT